ncbi:Protein OS-9 [Ophidiomyces ophidiicola]|nr:Protein OS-9 [Ophidiomyces ophidiicola]
MRRRVCVHLAAFVTITTVGAFDEKPFRVQDDVLGFPQYEIQFLDEYILVDDVSSWLPKSFYRKTSSATTALPSRSSTSLPLVSQTDGTELSEPDVSYDSSKKQGAASSESSQEDDSIVAYEEMVIGSQKFICSIPTPHSGNLTGNDQTPPDQEKELSRATHRGLELLKDMEGRCMYYAAGWWSYSFCYNNQVRQFHALVPGNGAPIYPPTEDPAAQSFVLGRFLKDFKGEKSSSRFRKTTTEIATRQADGDSDSWYLVQHLDGGTPCDLTGRNRKIEVQFHCHPQSTDHIGWIKEITTCSYLMVIYTPRLCNDVAFQPPQADEPHVIKCRQMISPSGISDWESMRRARIQQTLKKATSNALPSIGDIEVGAMKLVGRDGKKIEKGKVASIGEEKVEVIAISEGGEVHRLSPEDLKKYNLDPEKMEALKKQLDELANGKDWKMEVIDANGQRGLRGIIQTDEDKDEMDLQEQNNDPKKREKKRLMKDSRRKEPKKDEAEEGSDETYKKEL